MKTVPISELGELAPCRSFAAIRQDSGYTVVEAEDRFWRERVAEGVLRIAGVLLLVAGMVQWFLPALSFGGDQVMARAVLTAAFIGTGVALYFFASRGFRRALQIDIDGCQISIARLNSRSRWLVRRKVPMVRIESLVIQRPTPNQPLADLLARIKGVPGSVSMMRGSPKEIETLHRRLCVDIRLTLQTNAVRPQRVSAEALATAPTSVTRRPRREAA